MRHRTPAKYKIRGIKNTIVNLFWIVLVLIGLLFLASLMFDELAPWTDAWRKTL